jgi:hypothetical protein
MGGMKTLNSTLVAELSDILKLMGKLNAISLELQFQGEDLLRYRYLLRRCIELTAKAANSAESPIYHKEQYYKSLAECNLSLTNPLLYLIDLKTLTKSLTTRFEWVCLAYESNDLKLINHFLKQLNAI